MISPLHTIISRLRLRQLRLLIALDEKRSLHRAAEEVGISQPGATKALHELESAFGASLFVRTHQGLVANDLGRCVIRYARLIHSDLAHMRNELMDILHGEGGYISMGMVMGAVPYVSRTLMSLKRQRPDLAIELIEDTSRRLLALLDEGRLDFAICRTSVSRRSDAYDYRLLQAETVTIVGHPDSAYANATALSLKDVQSSPWIVYPANLPLRLVLEREFSEAGLEFPRHPIETASTFTMLSLLQQDHTLLALFPEDVADFAENCGLVRQLPIPFSSRTEPYGIVTRKNVALSPPARLLMDALHAGVTRETGTI